MIGGGIVGRSVACHLTGRGWRDVVLLEAANERHPSRASFRAPYDPGLARIRG